MVMLRCFANDERQTPQIMNVRYTSLVGGLLLALSSTAQTTSPQVFTTSGGTGSSADARLSWTIGETITSTGVNGATTLTQGFQQPELSVAIGIPENEGAWEVRVYPNPGSSQVAVRMAEPVPGTLVTLLAPDGKVVLAERMVDRLLILDIAPFAAGMYIIDLRHEASGRNAQFNLTKTN